mmetsp:Transcript_21121/g.47370  ORF Transcript_21121/g.47370 Transcript_21121/m.47370 type:complete len:324 (-) Transcript_21121:85-1056(-)
MSETLLAGKQYRKSEHTSLPRAGDFATVWLPQKAPLQTTSEELVAGSYEVNASVTSRHNLRSSPSVAARVVGVLLAGDVVDIEAVVGNEGATWGRLVRQGSKTGPAVWALLSDGQGCIFLKLLQPLTTSSMLSHSWETPVKSGVVGQMPTKALDTSIWPGPDGSEHNRLVARVLGDPAAESTMAREAFEQIWTSAAQGKQAEQEMQQAARLASLVEGKRQENEARKRIAPFLAEQRQAEMQRWGEWQSQVLSCDMLRMRAMEHMKSNMQAADRDLTSQLRRLGHLRHQPDKAMDLRLVQSLAQMDAQLARCYQDMLLHSANDA